MSQQTTEVNLDAVIATAAQEYGSLLGRYMLLQGQYASLVAKLEAVNSAAQEQKKEETTGD